MFKNNITLSTYIYIMYLVLYKLKPVNLWYPVEPPCGTLSPPLFLAKDIENLYSVP